VDRVNPCKRATLYSNPSFPAGHQLAADLLEGPKGRPSFVGADCLSATLAGTRLSEPVHPSLRVNLKASPTLVYMATVGDKSELRLSDVYSCLEEDI
jgi:hypothetical protein